MKELKHKNTYVLLNLLIFKEKGAGFKAPAVNFILFIKENIN